MIESDRKKKRIKGMVVLACNPSTCKVEAKR
jgi:hypothetical protein